MSRRAQLERRNGVDTRGLDKRQARRLLRRHAKKEGRPT